MQALAVAFQLSGKVMTKRQTNLQLLKSIPGTSMENIANCLNSDISADKYWILGFLKDGYRHVM